MKQYNQMFKLLLFGAGIPILQFVVGPIGILCFGWKRDIKFLFKYTSLSVIIFSLSVGLWDLLFGYMSDGGGLIFIFMLTIIYPIAFIISLFFPNN